MNRRIGLIKYTFLKRRLGGSMKAWLLNCLGPTCSVLSKRLIEEIDNVDDYIKIKIRNREGFLFYHKSLPLHSLYQTLAEQLYEWHWHYYQIPQTKVAHDDIILDCGCAEGIFSFLNNKEAKHIYAFEPLPEYLEGLRKTFKNITNVTIINSALGDKHGTVYLKKAGIASSITLEKTETEVNIDTIDHFCSTHNIKVSYIKADLEGYEMNLLQGASEIIKEYKPKIAITTYHKECHACEIMEYLKSNVPSYNIIVKGIETVKGAPAMLHAW